MVSGDTEPPDVGPFGICLVCNSGRMGGELVSCYVCRLQYHYRCARLSRRPPAWWTCRSCCSRRQHQSGRPRSTGVLARGEVLRGDVPAASGEIPRSNLSASSPEPGPRGQRPGEMESESESERRRTQHPSSNMMWTTLRRLLGGPFDRHLPELADEVETTATERCHSPTTADANLRGTRQGALDDIHRQRPHARHFRPTTVTASTDPPPRSREEQRAWEDLDRARRVVDGVASKRRKRKAQDESPAEPASPKEPARKFKRPMTRRGQGSEAAPAVGADPPSAETETPGRASVTAAYDGDDRRQSFLRSLLDEVQASSCADGVVDPSSDGPEASRRPSVPIIRGRTTAPRAAATTAAVPRAARSGSPLPLTSAIEPSFPTPPLSRSSMISSPISDRPPRSSPSGGG